MSKIPYIILIILFFVTDQFSKWVMTEIIIRPSLYGDIGVSRTLWEWLADAPARLPFTSIEILPFFNIVMVWNQGISFGLFNGGQNYGVFLLIVLALIIIAIFSVWLFRCSSRLQLLGIAMVIGGALGNIMDRVRFGAVVDFMDVHMMDYHWPSFNISDSCISIGVFLLIIYAFFFENREKDAT